MFNAMKQLFIAFLISLVLCPPYLANAADITPDTGAPVANQATMDAAPNGVPVVNIVAPSGGISHNVFSKFNVGSNGVVFNNSVAPGVSQLGGALAPNTNLGGTAASTILNEVTGTGRSSIQGYMEVFGQQANLILANPNGISINGGGFINTPKATLTTGVPQFSGGAFQGLDVRGGDILVEGAGVNANNIDAFELVTRVAQINADIYAKRLDIITGQNRHNPVTGSTTALTPDGSAAPSVSIDSSALGGMYAGRIRLVGTEAGVGVNTQGVVQATQHLEMTADGKIQIKGKVSSAKTLAITSSGEVAVSGSVRAADTATVTGQTVTVAKLDAVDQAIVSADNVVINAGTLDNRHLIAGDSTATIVATNVNNTGTIYSGGTALFRVGDTLYNDQGTILAKGDMVLEGTAAGLMMATLQNDSGNIESLDGGLTFRATTFNNNNSLFTLTTGAEIAYAEGGYWYYGDEDDNCYNLFRDLFGAPRVAVRKVAHRISEEALSAAGLDISRNIFSAEELQAAVTDTYAKLAEDPHYLTADEKTALADARDLAYSGRLYIGKIVGRTDGIIFKAVTTRDSASGQDLGATIAAQGDILIETGDGRNVVSKITSATGDIIINANSFDNVGQEIYERTTVGWGRGIFHNHESPDRILTGSGTEVLLTPIDYAYGTIDAGNRVIISSGAVSNGVIERNGILNPPDPASQQQKVTDVTTLTEGLPSNGLFQPNTDPNQNYVIETNPALTDLDSFYGSDYAMQRMGFDPNEEANKRLCDDFCETRLVREQLFDLAGRRFLTDGVTSDTEQFVALMDNAVEAHTDLNLSMGIALTKEQVAALTDDIVWFERQEVNGEQVLVPVVYLASSSLEKIAQGGAVIAGKEVKIDTAGDTANSGLIESQGQVVITAENFFNNKGKVSGQNLSVTATDSIRNTGGTLEGTDVTLKAENDVVSSSATTQITDSGTSYAVIAKSGKIKATGNLNIEAGQDIGILGSEVEAGGDTTLKAGRNVAVSSLETTLKSKYKGSGFNNHTDATYNRKSTVKTGGEVNIEAGQDVAIHGSEVQSGGDANIKAGGNVSVTAATDNTDFYSHNEGGGGGFFGGKKSTTIERKKQTTIASVIKAGGSVHTEAGASGDGDILLQGSRVQAGEDVTLKAEGDIQGIPNQVENYSKQESKSSGFMGSKSMELSELDTKTNDRSQIEAGGKVVLDAKDDVVLQSARIESGDTTEITAREGQVSMLVSKDSEYKRVVTSTSGFFTWSSTDEGSHDETVQHTEVKASGGLTITTAEGVVVQYRETGNFRDDISQLAQSPGLEWMGELAARDDVDWQAVQEVHDQWSKSDSGIGGPGMQLVSLAMAVALSWTGVGATAGTAIANSVGLSGNAAMTAAFTAGFDSLITQAGMQVIANGGDVGAALKAMASIDTVRSLTTAMLTAGLSSEALGSFGESDLAKGIDGLAKDLAENTIKVGINTGVGTAINGGNLGENLIANLRSAAVSTLGAEAAHEIGSAYSIGGLDYVSHKIAHAALGGAMDLAMGGDGISGAIGGAVGEMTAEALADEIEQSLLAGEISPEQAERWYKAGIDLSRLSAGLAAVAASGDVAVAANAGGNAAENNIFFTLPVLIAAAAAGAEALDKFLLGKDIVDFFVAGYEGNTAKQSEIAEGLLIGAAIEITVGNIIPGSYAAIKAAMKAGDVGLARRLLAKASPEAAEWVARRSGDAVSAITEAFGDTYTTIAKKTGLPELPGWEGSLSARRLAPGAASHGSNLPRIVEGQTWLKGTAGNAGKVPAQIAEKLNGRQFADFHDFRRAFWQEVADDPVLSKQFTPGNIIEMKKGNAPFAVGNQQKGGRVRYEIDHNIEIQNGGSVYDMDNLFIRTPLNHIKGK